MSQQTRLFNPVLTSQSSGYSAKYWGALRMLRNKPFGWSIFVIRLIGGGRETVGVRNPRI